MKEQQAKHWETVKTIVDWILTNHEDKVSHISTSVGIYNGYISMGLSYNDNSRIFLRAFAENYKIIKFTREEHEPTTLKCTINEITIGITGLQTSYSVSCEKVCTATFPDGRKIVLTPTEIDVETAVSE